MTANIEACFRPKYDVVFLGLARNCEATLPGVFEALHRIHRSGLKVHMIVGENSSHDRTLELLRGAAERGIVTLSDTSFMDSEPSRLRRMAEGRQHLASQVSCALSTNVGVVDLDEPFLQSLSRNQLQEALVRLERPGTFGVA